MATRRLFGRGYVPIRTRPLQTRRPQHVQPWQSQHNPSYRHQPIEQQQFQNPEYFQYEEYEDTMAEAEPYQQPYEDEPYETYGAYRRARPPTYRPAFRQQPYAQPASRRIVTQCQHGRPTQPAPYEPPAAAEPTAAYTGTVSASQNDAIAAMNTKLDAFMNRMEQRLACIEKENLNSSNTSTAIDSIHCASNAHAVHVQKPLPASNKACTPSKKKKVDVAKLLWFIIKLQSCNKRTLSAKLQASNADITECMGALEEKRYIYKKLNNKGYAIRSAYTAKNVGQNKEQLIVHIQKEWGAFVFDEEENGVADMSTFLELSAQRKRVKVEPEEKPPLKKRKLDVNVEHVQDSNHNHNTHEHQEHAQNNESDEHPKEELQEEANVKQSEQANADQDAEQESKGKEKYEYKPEQHAVPVSK